MERLDDDDDDDDDDDADDYDADADDDDDDDDEKMRKHIEENHALDKASKCNFCDHEDNTWLGLKKHYAISHLNKH